MESLDRLQLERPQSWFPGEHYDHSANNEFANRGEIREGLARLICAEFNRGLDRMLQRDIDH